MLVIPFAINATEFNVFVALQDDSLERMKSYDPAQIEPRKMGMPWAGMRLNVVLIGYATGPDVEEINRLQASGRGAEITKFLARGFNFKPEAGDYDGPYRRAQ